MARPSSMSGDTESSLLKYGIAPTRRAPRRSWLRKCCIITSSILLPLILLGFLVIFVGFPLAVKNSVALQKMFLFVPYDISPGDLDYLEHRVNGSRTMYVKVNEPENITLGVLHLLPEALVSESVSNADFDFSHSLAESQHPVLLHFHGNGGNRLYNLESYERLREVFHVIGFDYRGYGDSSSAELTEEGLVQDSMELYKWLLTQTSPHNIYVWGHSLGSAIATHALARLRDENITAMGLALEAPFTTLREQVEELSFAKIFSWLPWFESTVLAGFAESGFLFETAKNILKVDCPVMILHAEDDELVPLKLGEKLYRTAVEGRDLARQGNVTMHVFPGKFGYNHWKITKAPNLINYIGDHINMAEAYYSSVHRSYMI